MAKYEILLEADPAGRSEAKLEVEGDQVHIEGSDGPSPTLVIVKRRGGERERIPGTTVFVAPMSNVLQLRRIED